MTKLFLLKSVINKKVRLSWKEKEYMNKTTEIQEEVTIKFAGDSGDGMQLTGTLFTDNTALSGSDLATFPDFPAEIRAPQGTLAGVSGFQLHFGSREILTPGDEYDVLVAMNAAALKSNLGRMNPGSTIIVNTDGFDKKNLRLAKYEDNKADNEQGGQEDADDVEPTAPAAGRFVNDVGTAVLVIFLVYAVRG